LDQGLIEQSFVWCTRINVTRVRRINAHSENAPRNQD